MIRTTALLSFLVTTLAAAGFAGTIRGKTTPANSVVFVDAIAGKTFPGPTQEPVLSQKGLAFDPHVLVVETGTTVQFQNDDNVQHNVFWPSVGGNKKLAHNMGTWPKGEKRPFKFTQPGVVPLLCNVHPEMSGYVVVSPTPYFIQSDAAGNYTIENVPDGKYTVTAWHEGSKQQSKPVSVVGTGTVDFMLSQ